MAVARYLESRLVELGATAYGLAALVAAAFYLYAAEPRLPFQLPTAASAPVAWASSASPVQVGDVVIEVGGVSHVELKRCRSCDPYRPLREGRSLELVVERGDERLTVTLPPQPWRITRPFVLFSLAAGIFWLAGMLAAFWLRPRGEGWLVLVLCFLTAPLWLGAGGASGSQVAFAGTLFHAVHWPFWALVVHLHLVLPAPVLGRWHRPLVAGLWTAIGGVTIVDAFGLVPRGSLYFWLVFSIAVAFALLAARLLRPAPPRLRLASRIMAFGVVFGLVPVAVSLALLSPVVQASFRSTLALYFAFSFLPVWPLAYLYAIHRHDLGALTSRANRVAGLYAFVALYSLAYGLALLPLQAAPRRMSDLSWTVLMFAVSLGFVIAASTARQRFQRLVDRVVFGIRYDSQELVSLFARRVPTAFDRATLRSIVVDEILPTFLVRQSALYLDGDGALYEQGLEEEEELGFDADRDALRAAAGAFIPLRSALAGPLAWVRLALPLATPAHGVGVWLFGRKDPDDFYTKDDVAALTALASQIAPVLENFRLLDAAKSELEERKSLQLQLVHAQKMEALGRFSAGIAHDFNNLLSVILGHCGLLLGKLPADTALRPGLLEVQKAGRRATELIRQLLVFSRQSKMETRVVDVSEVVEDVAKMLRPMIGEDVRVEVDAAPDLPSVEIDSGQLGQVIVNLAANARDAMPSGGRLLIKTAAVTVDAAATGPEPPPGSYVRLSVLDDGVGMTPELRSRIFEPFFTTKEAGRGTGLGLSIVYGFVKQSRGYVVVDSEVGRGTRFDLYFPLAVAPGSAVAMPAAPDEPAAGDETILLVEDEEAVRTIVRDMLESRGYRVLAAADAAAALELAQRHRDRVDLLLTDVVMPHVTGPELAALVAARLPALKVIYMSGYNEAALPEDAANGHRRFLLQKPFEATELARFVREVLEADREMIPG